MGNRVRNVGDWDAASSRANAPGCNASCHGFPEILLTEQEVGRRLRLSRSALFTLRQTGRIGYVRFGTSIRYRVGDVVRFIEENAHNG